MSANKSAIIVAILFVIGLTPAMVSAHGCGSFSIGIGLPIFPFWGGYYPSYSYSYPYYSYPYYYPSYPYYSTTVPAGGSTAAGVQVPDYDGLIAIGTKMKMQGTVQPITQTATQVQTSQAQALSQADKLSDDGIKAFESQDYSTAVEKLRMAVRLDPNDTTLPLMYAQALFANNEYENAGAVIVTLLTEMNTAQHPEILYPMGLYKNQMLLQKQIRNLERAVSMDPQNADMHLLLGYHYLAVGRINDAKAAIEPTLNDKHTEIAAQVLMKLIEQVKAPQSIPDANSPRN
jgi:tetratricopeptide (TPR) repeat protein